MEALETLVIETGPRPVGAVIWLHGLGADAHDFEPVVPMLGLGPDRQLRYIFPNAPVRPVTVNGGMPMRAWYDIASLGGTSAGEDEPGIRSSAQAIESLIREQESAGLDPGRVLLAGFSQGGAMALHTGLRQSRRLAGILALSCYLPLSARLGVEMTAASREVPIFMAHGEADPVVPIGMGRASCELLLAAGCDLRWHSYPMMHAVIPEELRDIREFFDRCFPPGS